MGLLYDFGEFHILSTEGGLSALPGFQGAAGYDAQSIQGVSLAVPQQAHFGASSMGMSGCGYVGVQGQIWRYAGFRV